MNIDKTYMRLAVSENDKISFIKQINMTWELFDTVHHISGSYFLHSSKNNQSIATKNIDT